MLDDAANEQQVRPLLPAGSDCAVLITARDRLGGLAGARLTELDVLAPQEALSLFTTIGTLNFSTVLVTSAAGHPYRVGIITNNTSLVFSKPVDLGEGWTHDLLTYDGSGHLFGIADGTLRRYNIGAAKPNASHITGNTLIDTGFTLKTLGSTGPDWLRAPRAPGSCSRTGSTAPATGPATS
ncbi:hypothetical protein [Streptomyces thinghirensis]|uniref:Uncharacterized protein n=1 Tax=Streptomyces thinghirensis TaxID=551547 RepID=A0ABP9T277_9ACTN